jgi:hypothetical protein
MKFFNILLFNIIVMLVKEAELPLPLVCVCKDHHSEWLALLLVQILAYSGLVIVTKVLLIFLGFSRPLPG